MEHIELAEAARDERMGVWFSSHITLGWRYNVHGSQHPFSARSDPEGAFLLRPFMWQTDPV
jgi:hypothetical protein